MGWNLGGVVSEDRDVQGVLRVTRPDQFQERERDLLGRRDAILPVEDHAVADVQEQDGGAAGEVLLLVNGEVILGQREIVEAGASERVLQGGVHRHVERRIPETPLSRLREILAPGPRRSGPVLARTARRHSTEDPIERVPPDSALTAAGQLEASFSVLGDDAVLPEAVPEVVGGDSLVIEPVLRSEPLHLSEGFLDIPVRRDEDLIEELPQAFEPPDLCRHPLFPAAVSDSHSMPSIWRNIAPIMSR